MVLAKVLKFHVKIVDVGAFYGLEKLSISSIKDHVQIVCAMGINVFMMVNLI